MHRVSWERPQGQDPEPSPRPLSQARVYLEQIRNRVTVSGQDRLSSGKTPTGKRDYLVDAAKQIRQALDNEVSEDYEAAFNHYKNGVDLLLKGIQVDSNRERREAVKRKITQYLKRAEEIFNCHLQKSLGNSTSQSEGFSSFRLRPIRILSSPVEHLKSCKVIGVIDKVLLAQDPSLEETFVVKSLCKSTVETRHRQTIIPQGVPYMVQLLRYYVSEDAIFLHLEHIQGGKLWSQLRKCHHPNSERVKEYPECSSPRHRTTQLKTSHTSPALRLLGDEQEVTQSHRKEVNTAECSDCSACTLPSNRPSDQVSGAGNWFIGDQSGHQRSNTDQSVSQEDATCPPGTEHSACCCDTSTSCRDTSTSLATCSGGTAREEKGCCSAQTLSATEDFKPDNQRETGCKSGLVNGNKSLRSHGFVFANSCNGLSKHGPRFHDQSNQVGSTGNARTLMENTGLQKCLDIVEGPIMQTDLKGCYQIVVSPLEAVQQNIQPMSDLKESGLIPGSDSGAMPIRNMADTVSGKGLSELRTAAVNTLSPADQPCLVRHLQPAYPGREGAQRTSLEAGTQEEVTSDMGLQSSLHEGISVTIQSKSQHCCTNSEEPRVSTGGENGCNRSPSSPDEDMHIEVDGWCLVSSSPARKNKKPVHVPGGFTEDQICQWTAEIILALESIHQQGIICRDLNPRNILLDSAGHVCLTYFGQWGEIEPQCSSRAMEDLFCAPEVGGISEVTEACDWWSLGALLYELLTGMSLSQHYPSGINASTQLQIPKNLSTAAASLLTELLQYDAACRLGAGVDGVKKIKAHPFFSSVQWSKLSG